MCPSGNKKGKMASIRLIMLLLYKNNIKYVNIPCKPDNLKTSIVFASLKGKKVRVICEVIER